MTISQEEIRLALTAWGEAKLVPIEGLGDLVITHDLKESFAHRVALRTQYETRIFETLSAPALQGKPVRPPEGNEQALSAISRVTSAQAFTDETHREVIHDSHRITKCHRCSGVGNTQCASCRGRGKITCGFCGGMGMRNVMRPKQTRDFKGRTTFSSEMVRQPCTCFGGRITCGACRGTGNIKCEECSGHGSVHLWDAITHRFESRIDESFDNSTELPDKMLENAAGQAAWSGYLTSSSQPRELQPMVSVQLQGLLAKASSQRSADRQILFQHLTIINIPVYAATYSMKNEEKKRQLWIFGSDRTVHAPSESGIRGFWNRLTR